MNKKRKKVLGWMLAWSVFLIAATSVYSYHQRQSRNLRIICCGTVSGLDSIRHEVTVNHQVFKVRNFVYQNSKLVDARHVRLNDETTVVLIAAGQPKCVFVLWQAEFGRIVPLGKRKRFGLYWFRTGNFGGYLGNYSRL